MGTWRFQAGTTTEPVIAGRFIQATFFLAEEELLALPEGHLARELLHIENIHALLNDEPTIRALFLAFSEEVFRVPVERVTIQEAEFVDIPKEEATGGGDDAS